MKRFPSGCASAIQSGRTSLSRAEIQPNAESGFLKIAGDDFPHTSLESKLIHRRDCARFLFQRDFAHQLGANDLANIQAFHL